MNRVRRRVTKTGPIFQNSVKINGIRRSEFKNRRNIVHYFKISEKDKKICKKTRSNSKVTGEEIFIKPGRLDW
jgi:hypothetical protein